MGKCERCGKFANESDVNTKSLCSECQAHLMTVAILKHPICGFGDE